MGVAERDRREGDHHWLMARGAGREMSGAEPTWRSFLGCSGGMAPSSLGAWQAVTESDPCPYWAGAPSSPHSQTCSCCRLGSSHLTEGRCHIPPLLHPCALQLRLPHILGCRLLKPILAFARFLHRESREMMGTLALWALLGGEEIQVWPACLEHRDPQDSRSDSS